jgi:hypothetical protein
MSRIAAVAGLMAMSSVNPLRARCSAGASLATPLSQPGLAPPDAEVFGVKPGITSKSGKTIAYLVANNTLYNVQNLSFLRAIT